MTNLLGIGQAEEIDLVQPHIVNAKRFDREHFADDTEFSDWVHTRDRHILAAPTPIDAEKGDRP